MKKYFNFLIAVVFVLTAFLAVACDFRDDDEAKITGSIKVKEDTGISAMAGMTKISFDQALGIARTRAQGKVIRASLEEENGYLVYSAEILTGKTIEELQIDAGTGKILNINKDKKDDDEGDDENDSEDGED